MATLNVWNNFSKRKNSTKQPTGSADLSLDVKLKEDTSLANPSFIVTGDRFTANYAQYGGVYYYIDDIVSLHNGLCEIKCSKDVLATYKANIQAASLHVLYYSHNNTEICDKRLSTKTTKTVSKETGVFDTLGSGTGQNYAVALNVVGEDSCATYITDQATAKDILNNLDDWFNNTGSYSSTGSGIKDSNDSMFSWASVEDSLKSWMDETIFFWKQWFASGKVSDNLKSAYILPLPPTAFAGVTESIKLGKYDTQENALRLTDRIFSDGCTVSIPWQASDWRRNAPYHELYLYIPYIGLITLSPSDLMGDTSLNVSVSIDVPSGDAVFTVYTDTNRYIGQYTTNMAAAFAIGTSNIPLASMFNSIAGAGVEIGAALATGGAASVIGATTGNVANMGNLISGMPSCIGANAGGAILGLTSNVICYSIFHDTTVSPGSVSAVKGTPYNGVMSLSGVSGYVQTAGASVDLPGFGPDKDQVNSFLDGGIYIE